VQSRQHKKSEWRHGIWVTHIALMLGALAITIGLADSSFSQLNVFSFLAFAIVLLSTVGIVLALWRIERRSIRLRSLLFWYCLLVNLGLLVALTVLYLRIQSSPTMHKADFEAPAGPDNS
jgi:hypothetical protein